MKVREIYVEFVGTLLLLVTTSCLELEKACETPYRLNGTCIRIRNCLLLVTALQDKPVPQATIQLLKISHCGYHGKDPLVCCPSTMSTPAPLQIPPSADSEVTEDVSQHVGGQNSDDKIIIGNKSQELGERCETHNQAWGICIRIRNCPPLLAVLQIKPISPATLDLLRRSQCGLMGNKPLVCCPSTKPTPSQSRQSTDTEVTEDVGQHANLNLLRSDICGPLSDDRIINGNKTKLNELPWMALVSYTARNKHRLGCGGTIINDRYVLTAAHCVKLLPENVFPIAVRLGEHDLESSIDCEEDPDGEPGEKLCAPEPQTIQIEEIIPHPGYTGKPNIQHDIALIRLSSPADFRSDSVRPICLPIGLPQQTYDLVGKKVIVSGWGVTENYTKSPVLLKVTLPVVEYEQCAEYFKGIAAISDVSQLCAGGDKGDSCYGDSGGPLHYFGEVGGSIRIIQHGVVSFGPKKCGTPEQPGVYTRVGHFMKWILDNMKE